MEAQRTVPPPPPSPGSNLYKEQKFVYVNGYGAVCDLNAHISEGWKFVSMTGTNQFAIVLLEKTTRKDIP